MAVTLPASRFASYSIPPQAASASPGSASAPSLVLPTSAEICPRGHAGESDPCEKRRGILVLPSASCSANPQRSRPKPPQTDMFAPGHASLQSNCQPRALHMTSFASRTPEHVSVLSQHFCFCASDPLGIIPQGRHTGMKTEPSAARTARFTVLPRDHGPRATLRQEQCRSSQGHHRTTRAGPSGLILASAPGVCAWAAPFCPFLAKTGGSRWDFIAIYFVLPVRSSRRFI